MSATVPVARPGVPLVTGIKSGLPVLATEHAGAARLMNHAMGRGQVAPCYSPGTTIAAGQDRSFIHWHGPRYQAIQRVWVFSLRSTSTTLNSTVAIRAPFDAADANATVTVSGDRDALNSFMVVENRASQSATAEQVSCNLDVTGNDCVVESIGWWDMPRAQLALDANDDGVDLLGLQYRQAIYDGTNRSVGGEADAVLAALTAVRRVLGEWAVPATVTDALQVTATSYTALPGSTIVLARKLFRSSTTGTLSARVYAKTDDASDIADVRFTTTSGASAVINIPTNSHAAFAFFGAPLTFQADCTDYDEPDGLRDGDWDELTIEAKVTAGGDKLYLASRGIWEAP